MMDKRAIFVLGMHRSGTSALTGMLSKLGVAMPARLLDVAPDNPKGFFESAAVITLSDEILASGGSYWFDWRPFAPNPDLTPIFEAKIAHLLKSEFGDAKLIGIKDPRLCRMAPLWLSAAQKAGYEPLVVIPYRHPYGTMQSLHKRSGLSMSKCKLLWLRHTLDAEFASRNYPRAFVFMPDLLNDWNTVAERISKRLGDLPLSSNPEIDSFLDKDMQHHVQDDGADETLDEWTKDVLSALKGLDRDEDVKANQARLDIIRVKLDESSRLFGVAMAEADTETQNLANHVHHLQDELKRESAKIVEGMVLAENQVQAVQQALDSLVSGQSDQTLRQVEGFVSVTADIRSIGEALTGHTDHFAAVRSEAQKMHASVEEAFTRQADNFTQVKSEIDVIRASLGDVITSQVEARERYTNSMEWAKFETQAIRQALGDILSGQAQADERQTAGLNGFTEALAAFRNDFRVSVERQTALNAEREVWLHHQQVLAQNTRHLYESYQAELSSLKTLLQDSTVERRDLQHRIETLQADIQTAQQNLSTYRQSGPLAYMIWALMRGRRP
ncbi:hypothetical protein [Asticcacaulis taihuensis]|uniref:sulfotransferase family protein n=1 Tax=Asticcacaulis taihuensis TaxID=260084 RepID=UPI003F7B6077